MGFQLKGSWLPSGLPDGLVQRLLAGMAERRMPNIVGKGDRFDKVFIQPEGPPDRAGDLGDLEGVRHACPVMIADRVKENLSLVLQPAKGLGVQDAIPVTLVASSNRIGFLRDLSSSAFNGPRCIWRKPIGFTLLYQLTDVGGHLLMTGAPGATTRVFDVTVLRPCGVGQVGHISLSGLIELIGDEIQPQHRDTKRPSL